MSRPMPGMPPPGADAPPPDASGASAAPPPGAGGAPDQSGQMMGGPRASEQKVLASIIGILQSMGQQIPEISGPMREAVDAISKGSAALVMGRSPTPPPEQSPPV